jgi:hypothetical protein
MEEADQLGRLDVTSARGVEEQVERREAVEIFAHKIHVKGTAGMSNFDRLSDSIAVQTGFLELRDVGFVEPANRATGPAPAVLWVTLDEITLIGQPQETTTRPRMEGVHVPKLKRGLVLVTPTHIINGNVFIHRDGTLLAFLASPDPRFIPISEVEVRDQVGDRIAGTFPFALVNRAMVVAVSEMTGTGVPPSADAR